MWKSLLAPVVPAAAPPPPMQSPSSALTAVPPVGRCAPMTRRRRWLPWVAGGLVLLLLLCLGTAALARTGLHIGTNDAVKLMPEKYQHAPQHQPKPTSTPPLAAATNGCRRVARQPTPPAHYLPICSVQDWISICRKMCCRGWASSWRRVSLTCGQGEPGLLAAMAVRSPSGARKFTDKVRSQLEAKGETFVEETYHAVDITYQVADSSTGARGGIAYAQTNGFLLLGSSLDAVHQAVDAVQGRSPALSKNKAYQKVLKALDGNRAGYAYFDWTEFQRALN